MQNRLIFDPPYTPHPTHDQRVTLAGLVGRKGAKAYREAILVVKTDIKTASKSQLDHLIALMSEYPDLEKEWQKLKRR